MKKIFISYRRTDTQMAAGRLYDSLVRQFGSANVFRDKEAMRPGFDWLEQIQNTLKADVIVLALIGPRWVDSKDAQGRRRLADPQDPNRLELETALASKVPVIPILVEGAPVPEPSTLPASLEALTRKHAIRLRDDDWDGDFSRLAEALRSLGIASNTVDRVNPVPGAQSRRTAVQLAAAGLLGLGAVGAATWGVLTQFSESPQTSTPASSVSLAVQTALLSAAERTEFNTHQVTARVMAPDGPLPKIEKVVYLLPPSFGVPGITSSTAEDGFALKMAGSGSFLLQAKVYLADGTVRDLSKQIDLKVP